MDRYDALDRMVEIQREMLLLLEEAEEIANEFDENFNNSKAYVFDQIREHLNKQNPYNKDLNDVISSIEAGSMDDSDEDEEETE